MHTPRSTPATPSDPTATSGPSATVAALLRRLGAAFLHFWKTPSTLRTLLLVVLVLQPLLLFLAARQHTGVWNYVVLNLVFIGFWRLAIALYQKAFAKLPKD